MDAPVLALVHSPLVGPSSWAPVGAVLRDRGRAVVVPSLVGVTASYPAFAGAVVAALPDPAAGRVVLVAHSGAGALVPPIVDAAPQVAAVVFVDATLPYPGRAWVATVPEEMAEQLRSSAGPGGVLPPWHEWFPPEAIAELLPDPGARAAFCAEVPRLPVRYLQEVAPQGDGWRMLPCGYLQLSAAYDDAAAEARRSGWRVARVAGHHLSGVTEPVTVADAVLAMADAVLPCR